MAIETGTDTVKRGLARRPVRLWRMLKGGPPLAGRHPVRS